jgi:hypothetical protein
MASSSEICIFSISTDENLLIKSKLTRRGIESYNSRVLDE